MSAPARIRPVPEAPAEWLFPSLERHTLANGMRVVACHLPDRPIIDVRLVIEGGMAQEAPSLAGLGPILCSSLVEGTALRSADEFNESLELLGARFGAMPVWEALVPGVTVPRSHLLPALDLFVEAVTAPGLRDEDIARATRKAVDGTAMQQLMAPIVATNAFAALAFAEGTRMALPHTGTADTLANIDPDAVRAFWTALAHPSRATLQVVGDLRDVELSTLLAKTWEPWVTKTATQTPVLPVAAPGGRRGTVADFPNGVQTALRVGHAFEQVPVEDLPALQVANHALGGYFGARLITRLREEMSITYSASSAAFQRRGTSGFMVMTDVEAGATEEAVSEILGQIGAVCEGLTDDEVQKAANHLVRSERINFKGVRSIAEAVQSTIVLERPDDFFNWRRARIAEVTAAKASETFARYIRPENLCVVAAGPATKIADGVRNALGGEITVQESSSPLGNLPAGATVLNASQIDPRQIAAALAANPAAAQLAQKMGGKLDAAAVAEALAKLQKPTDPKPPSE